MVQHLDGLGAFAFAYAEHDADFRGVLVDELDVDAGLGEGAGGARGGADRVLHPLAHHHDDGVVAFACEMVGLQVLLDALEDAVADFRSIIRTETMRPNQIDWNRLDWNL